MVPTRGTPHHQTSACIGRVLAGLAAHVTLKARRHRAAANESRVRVESAIPTRVDTVVARATENPWNGWLCWRSEQPMITGVDFRASGSEQDVQRLVEKAVPFLETGDGRKILRASTAWSLERSLRRSARR